jgi:hypothetical protein
MSLANFNPAALVADVASLASRFEAIETKVESVVNAVEEILAAIGNGGNTTLATKLAEYEADMVVVKTFISTTLPVLQNMAGVAGETASVESDPTLKPVTLPAASVGEFTNDAHKA